MLSVEHKTDTVVIGGGMAGLATATFLARSGQSVRLVEQSHQLGGRARTKMQDGFYLNIGPHALYRGGAGFRILKELGVEPRGAAPSVSGGFAIYGGVKHTFPVGLVSLLTTGLFGLSAKLETARLLGSIAKIDGTRLKNVSVRDWVEAEIAHPTVRELILATFRLSTYTNAAELMSAGAAIEQLKKALSKGVLYLDHGWQTLVDSLIESAKSARVIIETGVKVEVVERGIAGRVEAVRLDDGRAYKASTVVLASSPALAAALVERGDRTSLSQWASTAIPVKAACLDVALNRLPDPRARFALGIDAPLYSSVHSASARLAPEGAAMIHVAKYLPPDHAARADDDEREMEGLLDLMQPGWRDVVVYRRMLPDMIVMNAVATVQTEGTEGRPGPAVPDVPGLFVAGDWVGREGLLVDASLASAKQAAELIVNHGKATVAAVSA
jgi:phytoene dehydrogenase-like protein